MLVKAKAKYIRISPRKVRLVVDAIRGLDLQQAFNHLTLINKKAVHPIEKLLKSAQANAEHNYDLSKDNLYIKEVTVDEGHTLYRWMPRAYGRATPLRKRTSIIKVVLAEKVPSEKKPAKKKKEIETVEVSEKISDGVPPEVVTKKKEMAERNIEAEKKEEDKFDVQKRKGGLRDMKQQEKKSPKIKGLFKKMFRRKSGM